MPLAPRRSTLAAAVSLALHAGLIALLLALPERDECRGPCSPGVQAVEIELVETPPAAEPEAPAEPPKPPVPVEPARPAPRPPALAKGPRPAPPAGRLPPAPPPLAPAPPAGDDPSVAGGDRSANRAPPAPIADLPVRALEDSGALAAGSAVARRYGVGSLEGPGAGVTLRPGDLEEDPGRARRREAQLVGERVERLLADAQARGRVEMGAVDGYFGELRHALSEKAASPPPWVDPDSSFVSQLIESYSQGVSRFGATGNPYAAGDLGTTQRTGAHGTQIDDRLQSLRDFGEGTFSGIVALVEIRQDGGGALLDASLVTSSGNGAFDQFALTSVPQALATLPPPPAQGGGIHAEGLKSLWAFVGKIRYRTPVAGETHRETAINALYLALGGSFEETTGEVFVNRLDKPQFVCSVRLLAVY